VLTHDLTCVEADAQGDIRSVSYLDAGEHGLEGAGKDHQVSVTVPLEHGAASRVDDATQRPVMGGYDLGPPAIAHLLDRRGGVDDVGEHDRQGPLGQVTRPAATPIRTRPTEAGGGRHRSRQVEGFANLVEGFAVRGPIAV